MRDAGKTISKIMYRIVLRRKFRKAITQVVGIVRKAIRIIQYTVRRVRRICATIIEIDKRIEGGKFMKLKKQQEKIDK